MEGELTLRRLVAGDIPRLTEIMTRAFNKDSQMHLGRNGGPDGYDDGSFLRRYGLEDDSCIAYTVLLDGRTAGAVLLWIDAAKRLGTLGCIFVDDSVQNQGLGVRIWCWVEQHYSQVRVWQTETPLFSHRDHYFYINKLGFHAVHIENPKAWRDGEGQFQLRKELDKA